MPTPPYWQSQPFRVRAPDVGEECLKCGEMNFFPKLFCKECGSPLNPGGDGFLIELREGKTKSFPKQREVTSQEGHPQAEAEQPAFPSRRKEG